jgi:hypothetical protein
MNLPDGFKMVTLKLTSRPKLIGKNTIVFKDGTKKEIRVIEKTVGYFDDSGNKLHEVTSKNIFGKLV